MFMVSPKKGARKYSLNKPSYRNPFKCY